MLKSYNYPIDNEYIREMLSILEYIGADEKQRKNIEDEQDAYRLLEVMSENKRKELEAVIKEKDEALKEKDEALKEKDDAMKEQESMIAYLKAQLNR